MIRLPRKFAHSPRFALPRITAPASRSRRMITASPGTTLPTSASDPAVVCIICSFPLQTSPSVAMLSLTKTGIPWSGPRMCPLRRSLSSCWAMHTASGFVSITECSNGLSDSIRPGSPSPMCAGQLTRSHCVLKLGDCRLNKLETRRQLKQIAKRGKLSPA